MIMTSSILSSWLRVGIFLSVASQTLHLFVPNRFVDAGLSFTKSDFYLISPWRASNCSRTSPNALVLPVNSSGYLPLFNAFTWYKRCCYSSYRRNFFITTCLMSNSSRSILWPLLKGVAILSNVLVTKWTTSCLANPVLNWFWKLRLYCSEWRMFWSYALQWAMS